MSGDLVLPARAVAQTEGEGAVQPHYTFGLDVSPSMEGARAAAANRGLDRLFVEQKRIQPPGATISVLMFNEKVRIACPPDLLSRMPPVQIVPCGQLTAVRAAVVKTFNHTYRWVASQPRHLRPDQVGVMFVSDGEETERSYHWGWPRVANFVGWHRDLGWNLGFVTVSERAADQATTQLGFLPTEVTLLEGTEDGMEAAFQTVSTCMTGYTARG